MGFFENLRKDWLFAHGVFKALRRVTPMARQRDRTFADALEDLARRYGDRPALISDRETLTYAAYNARGNRYARWAMANGVAKGDVVCLLMPNRPEYAAVWLGVARAGGTTALLNTNLVGSALAHCINIVSPKHIIVAAELADAFDTAAPMIDAGPTVWRTRAGRHGRPRIDTALMDFSDQPIPAVRTPALTLDDRCLFIYTSGTTGLPKAANINHYRVHAAMLAYASVMETTANDRNYNCLPMYHTSGGILAIGCCLMVGGSVFIRERFSARQFWDDVVDNGCTRFQYIGELCRYLVTAPPHPKETAAQRPAGAAATGCGRTSGSTSRTASASNPSANSMPPPRATRSSSTGTTRPAPSAASRAGPARCFRSPPSASTSTTTSRCAATTACASSATTTRPAR